jgi:hypothetical protein
MKEIRKAYRIFIGEPLGKLTIGRLIRRLRIVLKWILGKYAVKTKWIEVAQDYNRLCTRVIQMLNLQVLLPQLSKWYVYYFEIKIYKF